MTEKIVGYINDYLPLILWIVFMFIDRYGFGGMFTSFRKDITEAFNTKKLTSEITSLKDELRSALEENGEIRKELKEIREALTKVKGARKHEQADKGV